MWILSYKKILHKIFFLMIFKICNHQSFIVPSWSWDHAGVAAVSISKPILPLFKLLFSWTTPSSKELKISDLCYRRIQNTEEYSHAEMVSNELIYTWATVSWLLDLMASIRLRSGATLSAQTWCSPNTGSWLCSWRTTTSHFLLLILFIVVWNYQCCINFLSGSSLYRFLESRNWYVEKLPLMLRVFPMSIRHLCVGHILLSYHH